MIEQVNFMYFLDYALLLAPGFEPAIWSKQEWIKIIIVSTSDWLISITPYGLWTATSFSSSEGSRRTDGISVDKLETDTLCKLTIDQARNRDHQVTGV